MQTLVIGDIHGCNGELQALLEKAGLSDGDSIIASTSACPFSETRFFLVCTG